MSKPLLIKLLAIAGLLLALIWLFVAVSVGLHGSLDHWLPSAAVSCLGGALVLLVT